MKLSRQEDQITRVGALNHRTATIMIGSHAASLGIGDENDGRNREVKQYSRMKEMRVGSTKYALHYGREDSVPSIMNGAGGGFTTLNALRPNGIKWPVVGVM